MSKKVNPAAVGIFVSGAVIILVVALIVLGSGKFFEKRSQFVAYFQTSANGLKEGSDVMFGGVKVGSVARMRVQFDPDTGQKVIPVVIDLSADRIVAMSADTEFDKQTIFSKEALEKAIDEQGLRARLMNKSVLTGQLFVDLEFFPGDQSGYTFPSEPIDSLTQIPTVKSELQEVLEKLTEGLEGLGEIGLGDLITDISTLVNNLDTKVAELDFQGISDKANSVLANADSTIGNINGAVDDGQLEAIVASIEGAAEELRNLVASIDTEGFNQAVQTTGGAFDKVGVASVKIGDAAENVAQLTDQRAAVSVSLTRALASFEKASRSIEELADFLKRNPNALISGKKQP